MLSFMENSHKIVLCPYVNRLRGVKAFYCNTNNVICKKEYTILYIQFGICIRP